MKETENADECKSQRDHAKVHLWWCNLLHMFNDGYLVSLALLLPFMAADLDLSYTQSGLIKTASSVAISAATG